MVTLANVTNDPFIIELLKESDASTEKLGITEHGLKHAAVTADYALKICKGLGLSPKETTVATIAAFLHDIGNLTGRTNHGQIGAAIVVPILMRYGIEPAELAKILAAIANHDEEQPVITNKTTAVVIMADKADVRRSRIRKSADVEKDIHDRVNFAVTESQVVIEGGKISLRLALDEQISCVADYLEIFAGRMIAMRSSAIFLGCEFELNINGSKIL
jgi:hypothetical protein